MQEKKAQPQQPTQKLQIMRYEPREEDLNVNIMLRSGITTGDDKGKQPKDGGWVRKTPKKEVGFDLEHVKEMFMDAKKSFAKASTSRSQNKVPETSAPTEVDPSMPTVFLETCMKLLRDIKVVKGLQELINKCAGNENAPDGHCVVRKICKHKERTGRDMRFTTQIGNVRWTKSFWIWGLNANIFPKQTWGRMGRHVLQWSLIQIRLENQ